MNWLHEFPSLAEGRIHLNHSGVSPIPARAVAALHEYAREASLEMGIAGPKWVARVKTARGAAATLLNAAAEEIAFTKSTTHGLQIVALSLDWKPGDAIVVEETTFPANWYVWKALEARCGVKVVVWPERALRYEIADLQSLLLAHRVRLVSVSAADYATGFRHDLEEVGAAVRGAGALYCIDGIQVVGARRVDVRACGADFLSADGHKWMLGPEGAGILFVKRERLAEMSDVLCGWLGRANFSQYGERSLPPDSTARRFEEGALNMPGILALGASLSLLNEAGIETIEARLKTNRSILVDGLEGIGWKLISPREDRHSCGIATFSHPTVDCERAARTLSGEGTVCTARRGFLRLAPHFYQEPEHMERIVARIERGI